MTVESRDRDPLREAWCTLAEATRAAVDCPEPDRIWAAAWGELPLEERREIVDHLALCPPCAEAWRLARKVGENRETDISVGGERKRPRRWMGPMLLAAAALIAAAIGLQVAQWQLSDDDAHYRDGAADTIVSEVPEDVPQPRTDLVLSWRAPQGAVAYDVRITDASLALLARGRELEEPRFRVPIDRLASIPAEATLFWQVEAIFPDGSRLVSATFLVRIDASAP